MRTKILLPEELIMSKIYRFRDKKVMLAQDLAILYQIPTKRINEQVKRNPGKFPDQFMFRLNSDEMDELRSQKATLEKGQHFKYAPYAFTEHGILMLSSVLRSEVADQVNILIIETFVKMNEMLLAHKDILLKLEEMGLKIAGQDDKIIMLFNYLKQFIAERETPRKQIGFHVKDE